MQSSKILYNNFFIHLNMNLVFDMVLLIILTSILNYYINSITNIIWTKFDKLITYIGIKSSISRVGHSC